MSTASFNLPRSQRMFRTVIWGAIIMGWVILFRDTFDIREANLDDLGFHRVAVDGHRLDYIHMWGPVQGRHYGYFAFTPIWLLDAVTSPWLYQILRLGLVALSLVLLGRLAAAITRSPELFTWWMLLWIAALQIPPTFYGLLSYPYIHIGLIMVVLALGRFWHALTNSGGVRTSWGAGILLFLGLQFNEAFLAFSSTFALLWLWQTPRAHQKKSLGALLPIVAACLLYLGIYFAYRSQHKPYYEGTVPGTDPGKMILYLARYSASSLPGFELLIDRDVTHTALVPAAEIGRRFGTLELWRLSWVATSGAAAAWLLCRSQWNVPLRPSLWLAAGAILTGLLFLGMPAVSAKYQEFAYRRIYPHTYNFTFVHFLWLGIAIASLGVAGRLAPGTVGRRTIAGLAGTGLAAICLVAQVTNPLALQQIRDLLSTAP